LAAMKPTYRSAANITAPQLPTTSLLSFQFKGLSAPGSGRSPVAVYQF
jgi:hypothetical protein